MIRFRSFTNVFSGKSSAWISEWASNPQFARRFRAVLADAVAKLLNAAGYRTRAGVPWRDMQVPRVLIRACKVVNIELIDQVIVGRPTPPCYCSLRELGYFFD